MSDAVRLENVWKVYGDGPSRAVVLKGVDLRVEYGELVVIMGPSGSGKSTLLGIIGTLDKPSTGRVYVAGVEVTSMDEDELAAFRLAHVGFVFQDHNLLRNFTALENVMYPMLLTRRYTYEEAKEKALELLRLVGLERVADRFPSQLSGGQRQRVAIARALANDPDIVLMDEPTGNLDIDSAAKVASLVKWLNQVYGQTFLIVTHNPELATLATRLLYIRGGRIYEKPPESVLSKKLVEEVRNSELRTRIRNSQLRLLEVELRALRRLVAQGRIPRCETEARLSLLRNRANKLLQVAARSGRDRLVIDSA